MKIEKIEVKNLFGYKNFKLTLTDGKGFFFGENGAGKTTFLNIIYAILSGRQELIPNDLKYDEFKIIFDDGNGLVSSQLAQWPEEESGLPRQVINNFTHLNNNLNQYKSYIESIKLNYPILNNIETEDVISYIDNKDVDFLTRNSTISNSITAFNHSIHNDLGNSNPISFYNNILSQYEAISNFKKQDQLKKSRTLIDNINNDILYLNVYRNRPKLKNNQQENNLYEEGAIVLTSQKLDELKRKVQNSANEIKKLINDNYIKMSQTLLDKLLSNSENTDNLYTIRDSEKEILENIFEYIHGIDTTKKEKLKEILSNNDQDEISIILRKSFKPFIETYISQALSIEEQINTFLKITNKYLVYKKIMFDKKKFDFILNIGTTKYPLDEKLLSSGEKHIFSIFSNLVFNKKESIYLLIDEPELSLSINWQKMFIKDITQFEKVKNLIFVTHSPYVIPDNMIDDLQRFPSGDNNA